MKTIYDFDNQQIKESQTMQRDNVRSERTSHQKLLRFRLYGNFAHFNQPISNRFRNTYSIIPKPQLLGILGSIAGLSGYKNSEEIPEFYQSLKNLKLYIKQNNAQDKKFNLQYNSLNSFLNNRPDAPSPNVIIHEQVLFRPNYEIGIVVNEDNLIHKTIIEKIQNHSSTFPIYFGKNEFFASIEYISFEDCEKNSKKELFEFEGIFPFDEIDGENNEQIKLELLPIDFDENHKYKYRLMAIPQKKCTVALKNPTNCIVSKENIYYCI